MKTQVLGPGEASQGKVLNSIVSWSRDGWTLEADPIHAELIIDQLGIESAGRITTAGTAEDVVEMSESAELEGRQTSLIRGLAARANDLSMGRPEVQYASKEVCHEMSKPTIQSLAKMKRIGQYVYGKIRLVWQYPHRDELWGLDFLSTLIGAGGQQSRKSTSGGCAMWDPTA